MTDRELMQQALEALDNSVDQMRYAYETDWRHGMPTRKAQLDRMKQELDAHEDAITALRERLAQPECNHEDRITMLACVKCGALVGTPPQQEQEPVAWEGGEGWESLAWELCADENGEEACNELIWEGGPIPEPWGERWLKYEDEAKRLIALVHKHTAPPQRKPLTDEVIWLEYQRFWPFHPAEEPKLAKDIVKFARAIEAKLREKNT